MSTAPGVGGIAVIRVSGPDAFQICDRMCSPDVLAQSHMTMSYGTVRDEDQVIDDVVIAKFVGPKSFTGEDVIEISCHGSTFIQQEILRIATEHGCQLAAAGEFTKRSFLNGKMDLSQAEAVADLIASESEASHRLAMQQMKGGFSSEISKLREKLIEFASLIELELDFSEEDVEFADRQEFKELILKIHERVNQLITSFKLGNVIKKGIPVAIIGAPNSGKSTLLNALLNEERAIVSEIAGTTRDAIEDTMNIDGVQFRFIDTAGVRVTEDVIENKGIEIALDKARDAAIVIKLLDASEELVDPEMRLFSNFFEHIQWKDDERSLEVLNKVDLIEGRHGLPEDAFGISARTGEGINELKDELLRRAGTQELDRSDVILTNARHVDALSKVSDSLMTVQQSMEDGLPSDLMAVDIRKALHYLGEVTGEVTTDDLLGTIFSKFCIGK